MMKDILKVGDWIEVVGKDGGWKEDGRIVEFVVKGINVNDGVEDWLVEWDEIGSVEKVGE